MAPGMLPMPPTTSAAKPLMLMARPTLKLMGTSGAINAPPSAPSPPPKMKDSVATDPGRIPISSAASRFMAHASMACPWIVNR